MNDHQSRDEHWETVYGTYASGDLSWYADHLTHSMTFIAECSDSSSRVIDVGAGASTLVDDLWAHGYRNVTLLDISARALELTKRRLGARSADVTYLVGDVTTLPLPHDGYDVWHDRAVLHFLTDRVEQEAYAAQLDAALAPGGHAVLAPFAHSGPEMCSDLPVQRYDAGGLARLLGPRFELIRATVVSHQTPSGKLQDFLFTLFRKGA